MAVFETKIRYIGRKAVVYYSCVFFVPWQGAGIGIVSWVCVVSLRIAVLLLLYDMRSQGQ